ncbi:MAG: formate transporter FocA [Candidatus Muproteobacteria bacterium RBG_16_62_13]|uniref:Formate transporter FocA n=1 Tax=Candidatus Muproteobacteria bacterium RBG_16_62_13 TaxID=1817756 RepID=A0A1F6T0D3_9PROT|nr:MAG: formate transporter FocA [Candidatus Muproteobacteria bacterium RBG_16_62_13]
MSRRKIIAAETSGFDAYSPAQMAARVESVGVAKAALPLVPLLALGVLAGAFIAFGAMLYILVVAGAPAGVGPLRLLGGVAFSLGLVLVVVGGAELFTGNNLIAMAWADRRITTRALLRNWLLVYVANFAGAVAMAWLVYRSGHFTLGGHAVGVEVLRLGIAKAELPFAEAFIRGLLCNVLVCLAVWLSYAARDVAGKILAIVFPISAFVALGFEHSVANMYLLPAALFAAGDPSVVAAAGISDAGLATLDLAAIARNLVPVTLGNIVGGTVLVALVYYLVYLRGQRRS